MLFRFLLWILSWRINSLSKNSDGFKKVIGDYQVVLQFKTADHKVKRYYKFDAGKTSSKGEIHHAPTMAFVFKNASVAMDLIKKMGEAPTDKTIFLMGIKEGNITIEGDMAYMTWFQAISNYFGPENAK